MKLRQCSSPPTVHLHRVRLRELRDRSAQTPSRQNTALPETELQMALTWFCSSKFSLLVDVCFQGPQLKLIISNNSDQRRRRPPRKTRGSGSDKNLCSFCERSSGAQYVAPA